MSQFQERILERLIKGDSALKIAQEMNLSERQVTEVLKEAMEIQTEFLKSNAATYQQLQMERLNKMYMFAIERAMAEYDDDPGSTTSRKTQGHLGWYEAALKTINAINALVKPYLNQETVKAGDIFVTMIGGTLAFEKAKHLAHMVGRDIFEVIEGSSDNVIDG